MAADPRLTDRAKRATPGLTRDLSPGHEPADAFRHGLVLGKFLSPRLYVSYGISLAESINTIKMRYTLGDRWTIKTEAGKERSADLVYSIEK